jgi:hypothetical protein
MRVAALESRASMTAGHNDRGIARDIETNESDRELYFMTNPAQFKK